MRARSPRRRARATAVLAAIVVVVTGVAGCQGDRPVDSSPPAPPAPTPAAPPPPAPADACALLPAATARALLGGVVPEPARSVEHLSGVPAFDTCSYAASDRRKGTARVGIGMLPGSAATLAARKQVVARQPWETAPPRDVAGIGDAAWVAGRAGVALVGDREVFVRLGGFTGSAPSATAVESLLRAAVRRLPADTEVGVRQPGAPCEQVAPETVRVVLGAPLQVTRTIATGTKEDGSSITCLWGTARRTVVAQVTRDPRRRGTKPAPGGARAYVEEVGRLGLARRIAGVGLLAYRATDQEQWTVLVDDTTALELTVHGGQRPAEEKVEPVLTSVIAAIR